MIKISSCAKWTLTGEHTVIRQGKAIAFPLQNFKNTFEISPLNKIETSYNESNLLIELLQKASKFTKIPLEKFYGRYVINSNIPLKSGLGSSAALCSNIVKLCISLGYNDDTLSLGKLLENKFHKNSSGLDIAVSITEKPLFFENNKVQKILNLSRIPHFALTYSGVQSSTSKCVEKVQNLFTFNENLARQLDIKMNLSAELCKNGLETNNIQQLAEGINLGAEVFEQWGLYNEEISEIISKIKKEGALAAKPIGAGLGGYVLSLWDDTPPQEYIDIRLTFSND